MIIGVYIPSKHNKSKKPYTTKKLYYSKVCWMVTLFRSIFSDHHQTIIKTFSDFHRSLRQTGSRVVYTLVM
jgi:hypothetical protein